MRLVPINEAEAILEPFWDGGSSENPDDKVAVLAEYRLHVADTARGRIEQGWCAVNIILDTAQVGTIAASLERDCNIWLAGYDVFRVFASVPHWVRFTVSAVIDDQTVTLINNVAGGDTHDEFDGRLRGDHLTRLRLDVVLSEDRPAYIELLWFGISNRKRQKAMEAQESPYDAEWKGLLADSQLSSAPELGIFFDARDLIALREKVTHEPFKGIFDRLMLQAEHDMSAHANPEAEVGTYIPNPDRRWVRNRDMHRTRTAGMMERLAFVGLVSGNNDMSRLAARMALSAAHNTLWCESIIGVFPGATWHHRSFTEEIYCRACALVLDWAGFCLTPHGKQVIRDAIIMKGLPRIESDFKRMEYIRHMNQGIVFSSGRIIGLMGVVSAYPRYAAMIDEAERDLREMIDSYVQPDGGILEGMAYWNYTFSTAIPLFYALARYRGYRSLRGYAKKGGLPASVVKTGDYALAMLSCSGDQTTYLPINDAHADQCIAPALTAAYCDLSGRKDWQHLYARTMNRLPSGDDVYHLIFAPEKAYKPKPIAAGTMQYLPETGEVGMVRRTRRLGLVHIHLSCGPILRTHYHQDRGSFIIEANGEALAVDRGVTTYDHPEVGLIGAAHRHNLLYPEHPSGRYVTQPATAQGGQITSALNEGDAYLASCDNTQAWESGIFRSSMRRVISPVSDLYIFDDVASLVSAMPVSFRLNTIHKVTREQDALWVHGDKAMLRITALNWTPSEVNVTKEGIDSHLRPVNLVRLVSAQARRHRLLTAVEVVPLSARDRMLWEYDRTNLITAHRQYLRVTLHVAQAAGMLVDMVNAGTRVFNARCENNKWEWVR